jgi:hypothetical protein
MIRCGIYRLKDSPGVWANVRVHLDEYYVEYSHHKEGNGVRYEEHMRGIVETLLSNGYKLDEVSEVENILKEYGD